MRKLEARSATENRQLVMRVVFPRLWFFLLVLTLVFCVRWYLVLSERICGMSLRVTSFFSSEHSVSVRCPV